MIEVYKKDELPEQLELNIHEHTTNGFLNLKYVLVSYYKEDIPTAVEIATKICSDNYITIPHGNMSEDHCAVLVY